jgi:hypothetical protein
MLEQLPPFIRALRQSRSLQFQYQRAVKNPTRRAELVDLMRDARTLADNTAEALRYALEQLPSDDPTHAEARAILKQYQVVQERSRAAFSTKFQSAFEALREQERHLDAMLRTFKSVAA